MTDRLNVAAIGCGGISGAHLPRVHELSSMHLVATMDTSDVAAHRRAQEYDASYHTTELDRVLEDDSVDAVLIFSSHDTHAEIAIKACAAGKHIYAEKPLAITLEEARSLQQAVHESGVKLMGGWWFKHSPITKRLREVIRQPYFVLFLCRLSSTRYENATPNDPDGPLGRNGVLDAAGYNLHWIWHVMRSQPVEINAMGYGGKPSNTGTINIRFANGGMATSIYGVVGQGGYLPKHYAEVMAGPVSAATVRFGNLIFQGTDEPGIEENSYHNGFDEEMEMFANHCLNGGPSPMDVWEASIPTLIVEKAIDAMQNNRPAQIDLSADFYLPDGKLPASLEQFGDNIK